MSSQYERLVARLNMLEALTNEGEAQTEEIKATFDKLFKAAQTALTKFSWWRVDTVDGWRVALALPAGDDPIQRSQAACYGPQKRSRIMLIIWPRTDSVCCRCLDHTWNFETILQDTWGTTNKVATLTWRPSFEAAGGLSSQNSYCEKKSGNYCREGVSWSWAPLSTYFVGFFELMLELLWPSLYCVAQEAGLCTDWWHLTLFQRSNTCRSQQPAYVASVTQLCLYCCSAQLIAVLVFSPHHKKGLSMDSEMQQCKVSWDLQRIALFSTGYAWIVVMPICAHLSAVPELGTYAVIAVHTNGKFYL